MNKDEYAAVFAGGLEMADQQRARSKQTQIGPSEIGFCRQKTLLKILETPPSDSKSAAAARIGTAIHTDLAVTRKELFPHLLVETELSIKLELPQYGTVEILGHADEIDPTEPAVTDWKTVDGFEWPRRNGASQNHKFQRWLYALGAIQAGLVPEDGLIVRNVYIDRSGHEADVHVEQEPFDWTLRDEVISWLEDVFYARMHNEDASRDVAAPVCAQICEFFTVCRGALPVSDEVEVFTDDHILTAIDMYVEGRDLAKKYEAQRKAASRELLGLNGIGGGWQVRTTHVNPVDIAATYRNGYDKVDIVPVKGRQGRPE